MALEGASGEEWRCPGATREEMFGLLRRWAALESWAVAGKLGILRALIREDGEPLPGGGYHGDLPDGWPRSLTHEVALALAMPAQSAEKLMRTAWDLQAVLPGIGALLADGTLTCAKARAVEDALCVLTDEDAARAEAMIMPELDGKTYGQAEKLALQAAVTVDPRSAARRREEAERNRARVALRRDPSGAASLAGYDLPTDETLAAYAHVCARAAYYKDCGMFPGVRMDQLRAMAYVDILNGITPEERAASGQPPNGLGSPGDYGPDNDEQDEWAGPGTHVPGAGPGTDAGMPGTSNRNPGDSDGPDEQGPGGDRPDNEGPGGDRPDNEGPGGDRPDNEGPEGDSPDDESPGGDSPDEEGPEGDSPGDEGPGGDRPDNEGPEDDGPDYEGPGGDSPDNEGPEGDGPDGGGPRDDGPDGAGPRGGSPDGRVPRCDGPDCGGPGGGSGSGGPQRAGPDGGPGTSKDSDPGSTRSSVPSGHGVRRPGSPPGGRASPPRLANLVIPLSTLLGLGERPGEGHGLGPLDPGLCRALAATAVNSADSRLCVTLTSPDGIAIGHGCARPAHRNRAGPQQPAPRQPSPRQPSPRQPGPGQPSPRQPGLGPPSLGPPGAGSARPGQATPASAGPGHDPPRVLAALPARVNLTISAADAAGLAASASRGGAWSFTRTADPGPPGGHATWEQGTWEQGTREQGTREQGTWELGLPDGRHLTVRLEPVPTFECHHRHESHAYQPNDTLRHLVQVRDYECTFPTCSRHAGESDFEHAVPYDKGGRYLQP